MTSITAYEIWSSDTGDTVGIRNSQGAIKVSSSPADLLEFLRYSSRQTTRIFWDLDESIAPVLKLLPLPILERLAAFDEDLVYSGHSLYYLPDRMLRIGRSRFYGIKHFWSTSESTPTTLEEVQSKAEELISTLADCGMPDYSKLTSPIAIFGQTELGQETYSRIPKGYEIPTSCYEAIQFASRCDRREWISAYQVGHWDNLFDYDLSAAYPSCASGLVNLHDMEMWKSERMGSKEQGAYCGFLKGRLYLDPKAEYIHCSPIMTDLERLPGNPAGYFGDDYYLTLDELRFVERCNLGEFHLSEGWFLKTYNGVRPSNPFKDIMEYLYQKRYRSELASTIMKGVANQLVGKLIETRVDGDYGELRNDIYHALVLAQSRVRVAEFLVHNEVKNDELVVVQTDGARLTREIALPTEGMGKWRCNGSLPTIVVSPYKVYAGDKKPGHLTYDHITQMISEHPLSQYYGRTVKHRTTLRQAIQQGDISKVGELDDLPAHLDLVSIPREQNRLFSKLPRTGQSLMNNHYSSEPIEL
ncbi:MAG: hypothetical protein KKD44_27090 [Proteobacteria bacterium]|nr:hypothetical protein [Pseudomonadota bacterium]